MKQKDKELLLKDLCARLLYEVKVTWDGKRSLTVTPHIYCAIVSENNINNLPKLLLRPMSSMTEEEATEYANCGNIVAISQQNDYLIPNPKSIDWLNAHYFDYRGLIKKGLAMEAPEGMYNLKENKL